MSRRRFRALARRPAYREQLLRILVVCEGQVSEPRYLIEMKRVHKNRLISVKVVGEGGAPINAVDQAIRLKQQATEKARRSGDSYDLYDEIWCVLDVDDHESLQRAKERARANGILLAISNPCFELWLLLHFVDQRAPISTREVQRACCRYLADYEKQVPVSRIEGLYATALGRARNLSAARLHQDDPNGNPSTEILPLNRKNPAKRVPRLMG
jgi:hypothetical protein